MARKIPFSLKMTDGKSVRTIEELREHFDLAAVLGYYEDGRLSEWLADRYYDEEADKVRALDKSSENLKENLCEILGVIYSENETDKLVLGDIKKNNERREWLREYTADDAILAAPDRVAFSSNELKCLLDKDVKEIYLCGYKFTIPACRGGITYKGVNCPCPIVEFDGEIMEPDIDLVDLEFDISIYIGDGNENIKFYRFFDKNRILGIKLLHIEAEKGSSAAQTILGVCYRDGFGVKKDFSESQKMFEKAAEQDNAAAQTILGDQYLSNTFYLTYTSWENFQKAMEWYQKAAEQGYAKAQVRLGDCCYLNGLYHDGNYAEAVKWYQKAAEQDDVAAQTRLRIWYEEGIGVKNNLKEDARSSQVTVTSTMMLSAFDKLLEDEGILGRYWYR